MRAPGAVHVLRSAQAVRQSRRPCPPPGHVRLHSASCAVQVLWHAAAAGPRVAANARPMSPARTSVRRRERVCELSAVPREASTATLGPPSLTEGFFMPLTCPLLQCLRFGPLGGAAVVLTRPRAVPARPGHSMGARLGLRAPVL